MHDRQRVIRGRQVIEAIDSVLVRDRPERQTFGGVEGRNFRARNDGLRRVRYPTHDVAGCRLPEQGMAGAQDQPQHGDHRAR